MTQNLNEPKAVPSLALFPDGTVKAIPRPSTTSANNDVTDIATALQKARQKKIRKPTPKKTKPKIEIPDIAELLESAKKKKKKKQPKNSGQKSDSSKDDSRDSTDWREECSSEQ